MRILLDSHTALWWMKDPTAMKREAVEAISDPLNEVFLSPVTVWELGLKASKGKLKIPHDFVQKLNADGIENLPFLNSHAMISIGLPPFHGDPFDRALVAQCLAESLTFATRDQIVPNYGVAVLEV